MKMTISVGRCLKSKVVKEYIKKHFANCKSLCNLQELYTAFKEKHLNAIVGFSKFCALSPKWCVPAISKMTHSVCVCSAHQNVVLLVNVMDWGLTYKYLIKKIVCSTDSSKCIMHQCESCPGSATLKEFPDQELNEHEDDEKLKLLSLGHYRSSNTDNFYKETTKRDYKRIQRDFD